MTQEQQYLDIMHQILDSSDIRIDRTKVGIKTVFGPQMKFDLNESFPLLTTKKVWWKGVVHELLWLLSGETNIKYLLDNNVHIWDEWADEDGNLGPVYGTQWRAWEGPDGKVFDQITDLINNIKQNPFSRRHIVSAWNVSQISKMALPPCHTLMQFDVSSDNKLSCSLYQRSGDYFLGIPFNIASYSLLTHMIAKICNLEPGYFIHNIGNAHLYLNHIDQAKLQLSREPYPLPQIKIKRTPNSIFDFKYDDFELVNYKSHATIKAPIAV